MRKIFCIPGFGADEKIFKNLKIEDACLAFANWLEPEPKETLRHYAQRMAAKIDEPDPVIIGVSFGGMIALEIARFTAVKHIFLISTAKNRRELPGSYKIIGNLRLDKIFKVKKIPQNDLLFEKANRRLGAFTDEEKEFANNYRKKGSINYINWSFDKILNWNNKDVPVNTVHIHGSADKIFPCKNIDANYTIREGTHMMIMNRADEISDIINNELKKIS